MARKRKAKFDGDPEMDMTPMIDVCFLLLIFFLCATKFKTFEKRLDAYLPEDEGLMSSSNIQPPKERLMIFLYVSGNKTVIDINGRVVASVPNDMTQSTKSAFDKLQSELRTYRGQFEKHEIDSQEEVPFGHIALTLNALTAEKFENVVFKGNPNMAPDIALQ